MALELVVPVLLLPTNSCRRWVRSTKLREYAWIGLPVFFTGSDGYGFVWRAVTGIVYGSTGIVAAQLSVKSGGRVHAGTYNWVALIVFRAPVQGSQPGSARSPLAEQGDMDCCMNGVSGGAASAPSFRGSC